LIVKVTSNPSYRDKARWFQNVLREKRGLDVAADIIEQVFEVANDERSSRLVSRRRRVRQESKAA
jgi:UDP:flavonoid glycosyltransferase YjiC (YdhE family)